MQDMKNASKSIPKLLHSASGNAVVVIAAESANELLGSGDDSQFGVE